MVYDDSGRASSVLILLLFDARMELLRFFDYFRFLTKVIFIWSKLIQTFIRLIENRITITLPPFSLVKLA
jgi:hypothetical protein